MIIDSNDTLRALCLSVADTAFGSRPRTDHHAVGDNAGDAAGDLSDDVQQKVGALSCRELATDSRRPRFCDWIVLRILSSDCTLCLPQINCLGGVWSRFLSFYVVTSVKKK